MKKYPKAINPDNERLIYVGPNKYKNVTTIHYTKRYSIKSCDDCGDKFITPTIRRKYCEDCYTYHRDKPRRKRGRQLGHRLSEESKELVRQSRYGKHHSIETRGKISRALKKYFNKNVFDEMKRVYKDKPEALKWLEEHKDELNEWDDVIPDNRIWSEARAYHAPHWVSEVLLYGESGYERKPD